MTLPFTQPEFLDLFAQHNDAIWPAQVVALALAVATVVLAARGGPLASRSILALLAGAWAFVAVAYHLAYLSTLTPAGNLFAAAFLLEAALLGWAATRVPLDFHLSASPRSVLALVFVAYALLGYPLLGAALGHVYPRAPMLPTPCPTAIFTFGVLLLATGPVPWWLLPIPFLWSVIGIVPAVQLGMREDVGLVAAGVVGTALLVGCRGDSRREEASADARAT